MTKIEDLLREVEVGSETVLTISGDEGDRKIRFGQERIPEPMPRVAESRARAHIFHSVEPFAEYVKRNGSEADTVILADLESGEICAVLDDSDDFDREVVKFQAKVDPIAAKWERVIKGGPVGVSEFAVFLLENRSSILSPDGRELAAIFSQVRTSKNITLQQGQGRKAVNGMMIEMEVMGERQGVPVELPDELEVSFPLYLATDFCSLINVDLLVLEKNNGLAVNVSSANLETERVVAFRKFVDEIQDFTGFLVSLGQVNERDWRSPDTAKGGRDY